MRHRPRTQHAPQNPQAMKSRMSSRVIRSNSLMLQNHPWIHNRALKDHRRHFSHKMRRCSAVNLYGAASGCRRCFSLCVLVRIWRQVSMRYRNLYVCKLLWNPIDPTPAPTRSSSLSLVASVVCLGCIATRLPPSRARGWTIERRHECCHTDLAKDVPCDLSRCVCLQGDFRSA